MSSSVIILVGVLMIVALFITGASIWIALSAGAIFMLLSSGIPTAIVPVGVLNAVDAYTLMACPFFILVGNVMSRGGCSPYIFNIVNSFIGRIRGGVAFSTVIVCIIYGAITGSTTATMAGAAAICVPNMLDAGYSKKFCAALISASATLGQLIPPSVFMIIYASLVQENVGTLFLSGILPGLLCGGAIMVVAFFKSPKASEMTIAKDPEYFTWKSRGRFFAKGFPAVLMPLLVLGSIYTGVATPTEAAAVACVYGTVIAMFLYRGMDGKTLLQCLKDSVGTLAIMWGLVAAASLFALPLTMLQIPQAMSKFVADIGLGGNMLLCATVLLVLILGCFMDSTPILILVVPILHPALLANGISMVHFNVIMIVALQIGQLTPPFGLSLYLASNVVGCDIVDIIKEVWPYILVLTVTLFILIFFPQISLLIPTLAA